MKVLITSGSKNPYIAEIAAMLGKDVYVKNAVADFWDPAEFFDIVHIQWPEELTGWNPPGEARLAAFKQRIEHWKNNGAKIVVTRHNTLPNKKDAAAYIGLYNYTYSIADAVIHLGKFSFDEFAADKKYSHLLNWLVPHHIYTGYPNKVSTGAARKALGIPQNAKVVLYFGQIRTAAERELILTSFAGLDVRDKFLLAPSFYSRISSKTSILKKIMMKLWRRFNKIFRHRLLGDSFIDIDKVQYYFNAADVVVIPRLLNLTSGVVYLSLAFNKIIVGPAGGNIKEVLDEYGYPTFEAGNPASLVAVLNNTLNSGTLKAGANNKEHFTLPHAVAKHIELYKKLKE